MSLIHAAARKKLLATSAITAQVGTRIYLDRLPENPLLPAITVLSVTDKEDEEVPGWWPTNRIQVVSWSNPPTQDGIRDRTEVETIAAAVHTALHHSRFSGTIHESWVIGTTTYTVYKRVSALVVRDIEGESDYLNVSEDFMLSFTG